MGQNSHPLAKLAAGALLFATIMPVAGWSGDVTVTNAGGIFRVPVISMKDARWKDVIRQQYDYSCGSAAVATLLTYHYDRPTDETTAFKAMYAVGDKAKIHAEGFSMLEMREYLRQIGYHADGFRMTLHKLQEIGVAMITIIDINNYKHFVVVKGLDGGRVLVGDPAFGKIIMDKETFESAWSGTVLAIRDSVKDAQKEFNTPDEWSILPRAPIGDSTGRDALGNFTLHLPAPGEL